MAINVVIPLLIPLEEGLHNATRLLPANHTPLVEFSSSRYCAAVPEDRPPGGTVTSVIATHRHGVEVRYSITGGNKDGLFTIDQRSGTITLAATLDYEINDEHELEVTAESGMDAVHAYVFIRVDDVNDNPPVFLHPEPRITLVEEDDRDLPAPVAKVTAVDADFKDGGRLVYRVTGPGTQEEMGDGEAFFAIHARTGDLIQLRALDRDPPHGRGLWRLRVEVRDGQWWEDEEDIGSSLVDFSSPTHHHRQASWGHREPARDPHTRVPSRHASSGMSIATPLTETYRNWRTERDVPISEPAVSRVKESGSLLMDESVPWSTAGATRPPRPESLVSDKAWLQKPHSSALELTYDSGGKIPSPTTRDKDVNSKQDLPPAPKGWRDRRGTLPHDSQMRHVVVAPRKPRHAPYSVSREDGHVASSPRQEIRGDALYEKRWRQKRNNEIDVATLGRNISRPQRKQYSDLHSTHHELSDSFTDHLAMGGNDGSDVKHTAALRRNIVNASRYIPSDTLTDPKQEEKGTEHSLLSLAKHIQGLTTPNIKTTNPTNPQPENRGTKSASLSRKELKTQERKRRKSKEKNNIRFTRNKNPFTSSSARLRLVSPPEYLKSVRLQRDASEMDFAFGTLEDDIEEEEEKEEEEENICKEMMFGSGGGDSGWRIHVVETVVTVVVKDINDNAPVFPDTTMLGHVQENGAAGSAVVVVSAWDADDATDGSNARLTYAIEKNVVDEASGAAIFSVEPDTGLVRTARCCLDREATPEYRLQVVAADGGGLKGTGTVVVRVMDENDNPPRLARRHWELDVNETPPGAPSPNTTLLELTAADKDARNVFLYRVVPGSGPGWENFGMRSVGSSGQLYALKRLDYEEESHRRGFRFMVQVTDQGSSGWDDLDHLDSAWVTIHLRDVNDNPPVFSRPHAHVTVREDTSPGTLLATMSARDPDMGGLEGVDYRLEGGWGALTVDTDGGITLKRPLDREAPGGDAGEALVVAVDRGRPPLSATATLTITVTDVNDCPPLLLPPTTLHVMEAGPPTRLGILRVTDPDLWALGHGPPFTLSLAPSNPAHVFSLVKLKFDSRLDSGRGGAELWTAGAVDREQYRQLSVAVRVSDAQGLSATHRLTVLVDDLNDNPMKPATKAVYLWKTQSGGSEAPLGRVFVDDPDDWDLADKEFQWAGAPHPLFTLHPRDGTIFASSQVREGRYDLQFSVSDRAWRQRGVTANVTVSVRLLTPEALAHAVPLALAPTTPADLTRGWSPAGGGGLGSLLRAVLKVLDEPGSDVDVVSVYGGCGHPAAFPAASPNATPTASPTATPPATPPAIPSTCVWVSVKDTQGSFMSPVKLQGFLALHANQLETATNLTVVVDDLSAITTKQHHRHESHAGYHDDLSLHSAASLASTRLPLQVVDTNATALVTPRLTRVQTCHSYSHAHEQEDCTPTSCLNGGRCIRSQEGYNRCVCPGEASPPQCKVLSRTFWGSGWAWLPPLPPCLPVTLSLRFLTRQANALLLYTGPLAPTPRYSTPAPMLALQMKNGRLQLLLEGGLEGSPLKLQVNSFLHDGQWHTLHLSLDSQGVVLMVDLCGRGWKEGAEDDTHCLARARWSTPKDGGAWLGSVPMQIGGLAHSSPRPEDHGWHEAPVHHHLTGCLAHFTVNAQAVDLGEPVYSHASIGGCRPQSLACSSHHGGCGLRGRCVGGLRHPRCECDTGWTGPGCAAPTVPARLGAASYMKVALSFTPGERVVRMQVRVRLRGSRSGLLLQLAAHHRAASLTLHLQASVACVSVSGAGWAARSACVERHPLGDGAWHTVVAERHGHNLLVSVDGGDGWRYNESLVSLAFGTPLGSPLPLVVDKHDGVTVGGLPEFVGVDLVTVHDDLQDTCLDDLRVSDHPLPLSPAINGTSWGQVTTLEQLTQGCHPAADPCVNTTCKPPLSCHAAWDQPTCSCGPGRRLVGGICEDVDECLWRPCFHGGSCLNQRPGFLCVCGPDYLGHHCQWARLGPENHPLAPPAAIAAITVSVFVLAVLGVAVARAALGRRHIRIVRGMQSGMEKGSVTGDAGRAEAEENTDDTMLELLRLKVSGDSPEHRGGASVVASIEGGGRGGGSSGGGVIHVVTTMAQQISPPGPEVLPSDGSVNTHTWEGDKSSTLPD